MSRRQLRSEALTLALILAIYVAIPLLMGSPAPEARQLVLLTLLWIAARALTYVVPALWRRWRGPRPPRPPLPTGRYGE